MTFQRLFAFVVLAVVLSACAMTEDAFTDQDLFLTDVTIVDVKDGRLLKNKTIVVRDQRIYRIGSSRWIQPPSDDQVLARGGYAVPGLWDMHVHSMSSPFTAIDYDFPLFLANGVVGVRDMGSVVEGVMATRSRLANDPALLAPQLYAGGPLLDGQALPWYGKLPLVLSSTEEVEPELIKLKEAGIDFFKVYDGLSADVYDAVIAFGIDNDMPVAGHAPKSVNLLGAARAGQRTIEHLSPFGLRDCIDDPDMWFDRAINAKFGEGYTSYYQVTDELFQEIDLTVCREVFADMAARNTYFTPTLVMEMNDRGLIPEDDLKYQRVAGRAWCQMGLSGMDEADPALRERVYQGYAEYMAEITAAGVAILAGSDMPNNCLVPGFSLHWELARLIDVGFTPLEAIQAATLNPAAAMDRSDEIGQIALGYSADILIVGSNPLDDISHLRDLQGVMAKGRWISGSQRQAMLKVILAEVNANAAAASEQD